MKCPICQQELKFINTTHLRKHNFSVLQFRQLYPNFNLCSPEMKNHLLSISHNGKGIPASEEEKRNISKGRTGCKVNERFLEKIRENRKGDKNPNSRFNHPEKYITKQCMICKKEFVIFHTSKKKYCSRKCYFISEIGKEGWSKGLTKETNESIRKISIANIGKPNLSPNSYGRQGRRTDLNNQFFRSSWEANYARILNYLGKRWEYEKHRIILYDEKGNKICSFVIKTWQK